MKQTTMLKIIGCGLLFTGNAALLCFYMAKAYAELYIAATMMVSILCVILIIFMKKIIEGQTK